MLLPIRYSASGPIITNPEGGEALPGEGMQLRLADNRSSTGALVLDGTDQPIVTPSGEFVVALANPKPSLRYSARCVIPIANASAVSARWFLGAQYRVDGGAWAQHPWLFDYDQQSATIASMCCVFDCPLTLGSALPSAVLDASVLLEVQFTARVSSGTAIVAGNSIFGQLIETL